MTAWMLVLALLAGTEELVLREKAGAGGRFIRLADLLEPDRLTESARVRIGGVYLGRVPEAGQTRVVTAEEIRKELERRGLDPDGFAIIGERVEVGGDVEPRVGESVRRAVAFEIKRYLLERETSLHPGEVAVRVTHMDPETCPGDAEVVRLEAKDVSDRSRAEFTATLSGGRPVKVLARLMRSCEVAFAAREILPGKVLERADVEMKRLEIAGDEGFVTDLASLLGGKALVRLRKGAVVPGLDVQLKPAIRRGDVVRACSANFEVDARAVEDGVPGQEIALEFVSSKKRFQGRVVSATRVEVKGERE